MKVELVMAGITVLVWLNLRYDIKHPRQRATVDEVARECEPGHTRPFRGDTPGEATPDMIVEDKDGTRTISAEHHQR